MVGDTMRFRPQPGLLLLCTLQLFLYSCEGVRVDSLNLEDLVEGFDEAVGSLATSLAKPDLRCDDAAAGGVRRSSTWLPFRAKCMCSEPDHVVTCEGDDKCPDIGRFYNENLRRQCRCVSDPCMDTCHVVKNGKTRNSAWRRTRKKCKCPVDHVVGGLGSCRYEAWQGVRYYAIVDMRGKGCTCIHNSDIPERPTTTTPAVEDPALLGDNRAVGSGLAPLVVASVVLLWASAHPEL